MAFGHDGRTLFSGGYDGVIALWDVAAGTRRQVLEGHMDAVRSVAFGPDQTLVSGGPDGSVRLWDTATGELWHTLEGHADAIFGVAYSPDGRIVAGGGGDGAVRLWDAATGQLWQVLEGHTDAVWSLAYSPDGQTLASGGGDGVVRLWDVTMGQLRHILEPHANGVFVVAFAPDGQTLVSGSGDGAVRLWDAATGELRHALKGHAGSIYGLSFAPDSQTLASGGRDAAVRLWHRLPASRSDVDNLADLRRHMLDLINHERMSKGLEPVNLAYNEGPQLHAEDMVEHRYISHWNLRGETPSMRHTWAGGHEHSAENISFKGALEALSEYCASPISAQDLEDMMHWLMNSLGHRDNILRPLHREVSVGIADSCHAMAAVQVFEGEYVRFSHLPSVEAGWFVMAGQVAPEVDLNDSTNLKVEWVPLLAAYTTGQVSQTFCYSPGRPVAYIRRPLPPGLRWSGGESQTEDWERCPSPRDADPHLQLPQDRAAIEQLSWRIRDGFHIRETVDVALVTAQGKRKVAGRG